jgi:DNA-binding MarR family transcriptional regulator
MQRRKIIETFFENVFAMKRLFLRPTGKENKATSLHMPTHARMCVMGMLSHHKVLGATEIAERLNLTPSAATQLIDAMVKDGSVERKANADDRRKTNIILTTKGKKLLEAAKKARLVMLEKMFEALTDNELKELERLQQKMITHFSKTYVGK